ncbi:CGNR zinc finger domain-containing protein [Catellatospora sp. NPDC049609]|uniref:CGNR zinc finger domain-containing protein n=1 Tax=Catellatospora sp. NPDC049609 TaxID=3155505 RepID=UPI003415C4F9
MRPALELANTTYADQGGLRDALETPADLAAWLGRVDHLLAVRVDARSRAAVGRKELAAARDLRAAIRAVASAAASGQAPDPAQLERLNAAVRAAPRWQELDVHDGAPRLTSRHGAAAVTGALAEVAADAVVLFAEGRVGVCGAPGCVLLFLRDRPNREWCSNACGNRARVARHHDRHKQARPTPAA